MLQLILSKLNNKLSKDVLWTIGSFTVLAISGIIINIVITKLKGSSYLGVFNISYAIYIVSSQIAVLGIHYSVLRHVAYYKESKDKINEIFFSAVAIALIFGFFIFILLYNFYDLSKIFFDNDLSTKIVKYSSFGLIIFPLNKVLFAYLQGLRKMKIFSILLSTKYVSLLIWILVICLYNFDFLYISFGYVFSELICFLLFLFYLIKNKSISFNGFKFKWFKTHIKFGFKSFFSGMFVELNSRVDVLLVGYFVSDFNTGVYSFVAMIVDGFYHLLVTLRTNYMPILVTLIKKKKIIDLKNLLRKTKKIVYSFSVIFSLFLILCFYILIQFYLTDSGLEDGMIVLIILLLFLNIISAYVPFDNLMLVSGHPELQTAQQFFIVITNIIFNIILTPKIGIIGAALSMGFGYIIGISILMFFTYKKIRWNLLFNTFK